MKIFKDEAQKVREHFDKLPSDDPYMNKLASILYDYAKRSREASYKFNRRDLIVDLATELFFASLEKNIVEAQALERGV